MSLRFNTLCTRHSNVNVIQTRNSLYTATNPTMEPYCILLLLMLSCRTTCKIANSLFSMVLPRHVFYTLHALPTYNYTQRHLRLIRIADWSINTTFNETSVASHTATEASVVVFLNVSRYYQAESADRLRSISSNFAQVFISKNNFGNNMYFGDPF